MQEVGAMRALMRRPGGCVKREGVACMSEKFNSPAVPMRAIWRLHL
jgi:hypothetical protein